MGRPFDDARVRQAVHLALDREKLVAGGAAVGSGAAANQLVPPGVFGFDPSLPAAAHDLGRARELLAGAGFPDGFEVDLDTTAAYDQLAPLVAQQLGAIGIRARPRYFRSEAFAAHIESTSDFYLYSWVLGYESGAALRSFLHTKDAARGVGLRNRTGYSNPAFDQAIDAAVAASSTEERQTLLRRTMGLVMQDLPWVPLFVPDTVRIHPRSLTFQPRNDAFLRLTDARPTPKD
jgi:peptide/nickel transport system substrate-binding protein